MKIRLVLTLVLFAVTFSAPSPHDELHLNLDEFEDVPMKTVPMESFLQNFRTFKKRGDDYRILKEFQSTHPLLKKKSGDDHQFLKKSGIQKKSFLIPILKFFDKPQKLFIWRLTE